MSRWCSIFSFRISCCMFSETREVDAEEKVDRKPSSISSSCQKWSDSVPYFSPNLKSSSSGSGSRCVKMIPTSVLRFVTLNDSYARMLLNEFLRYQSSWSWFCCRAATSLRKRESDAITVSFDCGDRIVADGLITSGQNQNLYALVYKDVLDSLLDALPTRSPI